MKKMYLVLVLSILIGAFLMVFGIATNLFAFTYDVGRDMLALQEIVYHHKIPLIGFTTGTPGIFYGPWWYYLLVIPFAVSMGNPQGIAYFMVLTGIATIILMYIIGKKISDSYLGIALAAMVSFSPILVFRSSQIWNPNVAPFYVALSLLVILGILHKPTKLLFLFLGILAGLLIDSEIVFGLLLLVSYTIGLLVIARKKIIGLQTMFFFVGAF